MKKWCGLLVVARRKYVNVFKDFMERFWHMRGIFFLVLANIYIFIVAPSNWNYYDVKYFIEWSKITVTHGLFSVYALADKVSYPPLAVVLFVPFYLLATMISNNLLVIRFIVKLPLIIMFNLIYYVLLKYYGWSTAKYWLINYGAYSTIFGYQFDLYTSMFLLLSLVSMARYKNPVLTGLFLALAILIKPLVVFVGFIPLIKYYVEHKTRDLICYISVGLITGLVIVLPFMMYNPIDFLMKVVMFHGNRLPQDLSIWAIPLYILRYNYMLLPSWEIWLWLPAMLIGVTAYLYVFYRSSETNELSLAKAYAAVIILCLITNKVGNLNYLTWVIPFLAILLSRGALGSWGMKALYIALPIVSMLLYPFTIFGSAAVVHGQVFIAEDKKFYSAVWLIQESFLGSESIVHEMISIGRAYLYSFMAILYYYRWASSILYAVVYNSMLAVILYRIYGLRRIELGLSRHKRSSRILLTSSATP